MKKPLLKLFIFVLLNFSSINYLLSETKVPWPATVNVPDPVPDSCITSPRKGTIDLKCDGLLFTLHVPEICLKKACGLIVDIHGFRMSADLQNYYTDLAERGGNEGYIVIQPTANKSSYGRNWEYRDDNVSKVFSFMNRVKSVFHVMEERIHVTGFSQGSWMTWRFVCYYAEHLGSVAPIAFGAGYPKDYFKQPLMINIFTNCFKGKQVDVLYAHGKKDAAVHYIGAIKTVKKIRQDWNLDNEQILHKDKDYQRTRYMNSKGTVVEFINYSWARKGSEPDGHCFPGAGNYLGCGKNNSFHWGDEVVKFFLEHPKESIN